MSKVPSFTSSSLLWQREKQARTKIQAVKKLGKSQERNLCVTRKIRQNCYEKSGSISYWQEICEQGIPHSNPNETRVRKPLFADFFNMNYSPIFGSNFDGFSVLHLHIDFRRVPKNPNFLKQSKRADLPNTFTLHLATLKLLWFYQQAKLTFRTPSYFATSLKN